MKTNSKILYFALVAVLIFAGSCIKDPIPDVPGLPEIVTTSPANLEIDVLINTNITATFTEAMNPASITNATFILSHGATSYTCVVTYAGLVATLNPTGDLAAETTYTVTITTGAEDAGGHNLESDYVWTFTTVTSDSPGPAVVNLGSAGNYVILSKSGIDTVPTSAITGDIGVSPAAATYITGFSLSMDASNVFSTSSQITGNVYAADYTPPTPSNLTTAVGDMETAYVDAAGRSLPDFTELAAGDISGLTLVPGLYKWSTGVLMTSDVTLNGNATDVWIFQISQGVTIAPGARIIMAGGALPKNVFWQAFGAFTLNTTSHLEGIVLSQTAITLATGATVNGRLYAQTAVTLDSNIVTQPAP